MYEFRRSFGVVSVTAETDCPLTVSLSVTAISGKTTFGRSLDLSHSSFYFQFHILIFCLFRVVD